MELSRNLKPEQLSRIRKNTLTVRVSTDILQQDVTASRLGCSDGVSKRQACADSSEALRDLTNSSLRRSNLRSLNETSRCLYITSNRSCTESRGESLQEEMSKVLCELDEAIKSCSANHSSLVDAEEIHHVKPVPVSESEASDDDLNDSLEVSREEKRCVKFLTKRLLRSIRVKIILCKDKIRQSHYLRAQNNFNI